MNLKEHLAYLSALQEVKQPLVKRKLVLQKKKHIENRLKPKTFTKKKY